MTAIILTLLALFVLPYLYVRDARWQRKERAALFSQCLELFQSYRVTQNGPDFPTLEGRYRGFPVRLEPVLDAVAWRKVPSLWLKVTLLKPNPVRATFDYLVRPQGVEFYSPSSDLPHQMRVPEGWPQYAVLCTDDVEWMPAPRLFTEHIRLFADERMKELLVTPLGTRLVRQIAQAERGDYLVLRQARFAKARAEAAVVEAMLNATLDISASLVEAA